MPKKNPAKKRPWKRVESFGHLKKAFLIGGLGLSNLAVLGFALGVYFQSQGPGERFYSMSGGPGESLAAAPEAGADCRGGAEKENSSKEERPGCPAGGDQALDQERSPSSRALRRGFSVPEPPEFFQGADGSDLGPLEDSGR